MMMRIKKLKMQDKASIRRAVQHVMSYKLKLWWTPLQMQAAMWRIGAKIPLEEVRSVMDDLFEDSKDVPFTTYEQDHTCLCYRCLASFIPN